MTHHMEHNVLHTHTGRIAIFIESREACLARLENIQLSEDRIQLHFTTQNLPTVACNLNSGRLDDGSPTHDWSESLPFGEDWDVSASPEQFYADEDYWQVLSLWGGGFRIFFQPDFVTRFTNQDMTWIDRYFEGDEDEGDEDEEDEDEKD